MMYLTLSTLYQNNPALHHRDEMQCSPDFSQGKVPCDCGDDKWTSPAAPSLGRLTSLTFHALCNRDYRSCQVTLTSKMLLAYGAQRHLQGLKRRINWLPDLSAFTTA